MLFILSHILKFLVPVLNFKRADYARTIDASVQKVTRKGNDRNGRSNDNSDLSSFTGYYKIHLHYERS
jgi:hypothetical protein